jgi:hypothetical protein
MKEIKLTQGQVAQVDNEDYDFLNQWEWCAHKYPNTYYADRQQNINGIRKTIKMHRVILNTPSSMKTDHIDHNGLNNQKDNLRICNSQQNCMNVIPFGSVKYKGVSILYENNKGKIYEANIRLNGIKQRIGIFRNETLAAKAYDKKARELFGEFAYINFPYEQ